MKLLKWKLGLEGRQKITALLKSGVRAGDSTFVKISIILNLSKVISSLKNLTKMWYLIVVFTSSKIKVGDEKGLNNTEILYYDVFCHQPDDLDHSIR